ncbi:Dabb family protein [Actinomadura rugatobispora]|uniref:Dabb family protein n=1 Tax=Actinomadura rugatobispora TaxID=1994 RepID=A0ABW0ZPW4_9ACTN|nr:hypothetical protein GCM10010200_002460 [Actinomadura rugatobispora]
MSTSSVIKHVNFWWLKEPDNTDHRHALTEAAQALAGIDGVMDVSVGPRTGTDWEGPDTTFDYGLIVTFESMDALRAYQPHPIHLKAIEVSERVCDRFHAFYFTA